MRPGDAGQQVENCGLQAEDPNKRRGELESEVTNAVVNGVLRSLLGLLTMFELLEQKHCSLSWRLIAQGVIKCGLTSLDSCGRFTDA